MSEVLQTNGQSVSKMNPLVKLINIFTDPASVFNNLREHPDWLIPVLLIILVSVTTILTTTDLQIKAQKEFIYNSELIPEDSKDDMIDDLTDQGFVKSKILPIAGAVFMIFISYAVAAAAFMVFGNFIFGGSTTFKQNFALYSWGAVIGVLETIVRLPLTLSKGSLEVYTSLALLMDASESKTVLFQILNVFDIFSLWKIVVWSIGFSVIYKFSKGKAYTAVITLYAIYAAFAIGIAQLIGGFIN